MADGSELVKFAGRVSVTGWDFTGFRGSGALLGPDREGLPVALEL
jgi:hypothetical protein